MFTSERYGTRVPTQRERRVIRLVAQGLTNREIAQAVGNTEHVVKNCLRVIYDKLGLWNRVELALWYEARACRMATESTTMAESVTVPPAADTPDLSRPLNHPFWYE